jgi:uncharacterized protein YndB with AHSA1/START domain
MLTLRFSIDINAPRQSVWKVLWDEESFRDWTSVFTEGVQGSHINSDWEEGERFEFFESGVGSYGIIDKLVPNEFVSLRHLGEIREGDDHPFDGEERIEQYVLEQQGGRTRRTLAQDIPEEHKVMFENAIPKALQRVKQLAENPT